MKKLNRHLLASLLVLLVALPVFAEPMTYSGKYDISAWLEEGKAAFDFEQEDAVILLEGRKFTLLPDGRRRTTVHRVIWIDSDYAIEHYADLRIPWDSAKETFEVKALRVYRDNRWIEHRPTAIVETLPFEVGEAPEYSHLRETMLLHDGVELPCILEAAYVIEEKEPVAKGMEGIWIFPQEEPVVHSWLILETPSNKKLHLNVSEELGEAEMVEEGETTTWKIDRGPYAAAPDPETDDPAAYLPHASWSTYKDWEAYGKDLRKVFDEAMLTSSDILQDSLNVLLDGTTGPAESVGRIAGFVESHTGYIDYPDDFFWGAPRTPEQTYLSGYGSGLDRAILFGGLCKMAGIEVWAVYRAPGFGTVDEGIATNDRLGSIGVWASGEGLEGWYNPASSHISNGLAPILGRTLWLPGAQDVPQVRWSGAGDTNTLKISVNLSYNAEKESWCGDGFYNAAGGMCAFDKMEGAHGDALGFLGKVMGKLIPGAEVKSWNPTAFDRFSVAAGMKVKLPVADEDEQGRIPFELKDPAKGILATLPADIHVASAERGTPAILPGYLTQEIEVTLELNGLETVYVPEEVTLENEAGVFKMNVEQDGDKLILRRVLSIRTLHQPAEKWNELRTLLLAETSARNRVLLFK